MHIGLSLVDLAMGGAQTFMVQLAQGLAARGHQLSYHLFASRTDPSHAVPALVAALDEVARPTRYVRDLLACDVIQLDGYHSLWRKLPYLFHFGRCVETYHSHYSIHRAGPLYPPHRVVTSQAVGSLLKRPSHLIYYGIPMPTLPDNIPQAFDIAILGRIHPVKQHLLFLQACEQVYASRGALSVLMLGGHPHLGSYQQQVDAEVTRLRQAGLHIEMAGDVSPKAVFDWLAQAKVLMVTSASEGFGRMAVEAMACGLPIVANPVGGLCEIVQDGLTGFLAHRDDAASFAELAGRLLADESLRRRLGRQGRARAESRFSFDAMLDAYEALYEEVAR